MQYIMKLLTAVISRLKILTMNPIRNLLRQGQMMVNINVIANKLIKPVTKKFREIFHIKPRSEQDYFSIGKLLISKRLLIVVIVFSCVGVFAYFQFVAEPVEQPVTATTGMVSNIYFDYDEMELMEYSGKANIRAANGRVVYTGEILNGACEGSGILYNQGGVLIYEGEFAGNRYHGQGRGYTLGGILQYEGGYADNLYEGEGTLYYPNGSICYQGEFAGGFYQGAGILYSETGSLTYEGEFLNGLYHGSGVLYFPDGKRRYEGEFVMGSPQGTGTFYTEAGRPSYTGVVANGQIAADALLGLTLADMGEIFYQQPEIWITKENTCYLYKDAGVILDLDCIVRRSGSREAGAEETPAEGDGWYLPEEVPAPPLTVSGTKSSGKDHSGQRDPEKDSAGAETASGEGSAPEEEWMEELPEKKGQLYYYIHQEEWVSAEELDLSAVSVDGVVIYGKELRHPMKAENALTGINAGVDLADCIAIEQLRKSSPSLFLDIIYRKEQLNHNCTSVHHMDQSRAVYAEILDHQGSTWQFCYDKNQPEQLFYYKVFLK